jgi:hypothetical protein
VKRRAKGRATPPRAENGRTVSEEITVLVNTLRELAAIRSTAEDAAGRILASAEGLLAFADKDEQGRRVGAARRKRKAALELEGPGHPGASQAAIDDLFSEN